MPDQPRRTGWEDFAEYAPSHGWDSFSEYLEPAERPASEPAATPSPEPQRRGGWGLTDAVKDVARQTGRGLAESGYATAAGIGRLGNATLGRIGLGGVDMEALEESRDRSRDFYGDPETTAGTVAGVVSRMAGDVGQFMVPGAAAGRAGILPRITEGGVRGFAGRTGVNVGVTAPVTVAQSAGGPEGSAVAGIAELTGSEGLGRVAGHPVSRVGADLLLDALGSGAVEGLAAGGRAIRSRPGRSRAVEAGEEIGSHVGEEIRSQAQRSLPAGRYEVGPMEAPLVPLDATPRTIDVDPTAPLALPAAGQAGGPRIAQGIPGHRDAEPLLHRTPETGAAAAPLVAGIAGGGVGGALDTEDPARGALFGALAAGGGARVASRARTPRGGEFTPDGVRQAAARDRRSFPLPEPIAEGLGTIGRKFRLAGDLPRDVYEQTVRTSGRVRASLRNVAYREREFNDAARAAYGGARRMTSDQVEQVNRVLVGEADSSTIPEAMRPVVGRMRGEIDALSRRMIDEGVVEGPITAVIDGNLGTYTRRTYQAFHDRKWSRKVDPKVVNRAKAFLRGEFPDRTEAEIQGLINRYLNPDADTPLGMLRQGKLGSKDLSMFKRRKDIPAEIRALMGEVTDPLTNYARSVSSMAQTVENHRLLNEVREMGLGRFIHERPIETGGVSYHARVAAEGSETLAPLNGLYTSPEMKSALERFAGERSGLGVLGRSYMKLNAGVKVSKTVLSAMTHVRNYTGMVLYATANGHFGVRHLGRAHRATIQDLQRRGGEIEWVSDLRRLGVVDESVRAGELRDVFLDASRRGFDDWADNAITRAAKRGADAAGRLYQAEDNVWKIYGYLNELERYRRAFPNMPERELKERAAGIIRDTMPTYTRVSDAVKYMRRFPLLGTFVTFPAEVFRNTANTLSLISRELADPATRAIGMERAVGFLAAGASVGGAAMASRYITGIDREEDEALRQFMPWWSENSNLIHLGKDEEGNYRHIDLSYTDPYSYIRKPLTALLRGEDWQESLTNAVVEAGRPFFSEEILFQHLADLTRNERRGGGQVWNPADHPTKQVEDIASHLWQAFEPGTVSSLRRIEAGLSGRTSPTGRTFDTADEVQALLSGMRRGGTDVQQALRFRMRDYQSGQNDARRQLNSVAFNRGQVAEKELRQAYRTMDSTRRKRFEEATRYMVSAFRLGISPEDIERELRDSGLSGAEVDRLFAGEYEPYIPPANYLLDADIPDAVRRRQIIASEARAAFGMGGD